MKYIAKNIFNVPNPGKYKCEVSYYKSTHSYLVIKANHITNRNIESLRFSFIGVEYFKGPMSWPGVDFCIATPDECDRLLHRLGIDGRGRAPFSLFVVDFSNFQIQILAPSSGANQDPP